MKRLLTPLFALASLAMTNTSCSDELENGASGNSNEATVSFDVQLENAAGSRAVGDGTTATELHYAVYKVANAENTTIGDEIAALRGQGTTTMNADLTAEVKFTLVKGQTYNFLFWAQCKDGSKYYTLDYGNGFVTVNYADNAATTDVNEGRANNEERDAFFKVRKGLKITGPINETITLKRPFAQVNVGTTIGSLANAAKAETNIQKSSIIIKDAATKLNAFTGAATEKKTVAYAINNIIENMTNLNDGEGDLKDVDDTDYEYLAMNYILVADELDSNKDDELGVGENKQLVNATFAVYEAGNETPVNTFEIPNVPVQRNWRTNIIGDILNETVTFNVVIDPKFDNDHNYFTEKELAYAFASGGEVTLDKDVETSHTMEVAEGKNVVLNLNGKTINNKNIKATTENPTPNYDVIIVRKDATLTINGEGVIEALNNSNDGYAVIVEGTLIINGGTFKAGIDENGKANAVIYARGNGKIIVNGGTFPNDASSGFVLNKKDADRATTTIEVTGGTFTGFNPGNNAAEGAGTNFLAKGYTAVNTGTATASVYEVIVAPTADTNGNMVLTGNGIVMNSISIANGGALDGKGHTVTVAATPATNHLVKGTGNATVKNLTIVGNGEYYDTDKSTRALYFDGTMGDVVISNVHVSGVGYALNVNSSKGSGKLNVNNSTLEGWSSFADVFTEAKFTNVHFGIGTYFDANSMYNGGIRPYMTTVFENCTFEEGFYISWEKIDATETLTFKNCKVGNTLLDATNIWNLLEKEGTPDANSIKF